jgi:hypothetical protein
MAMTLEALQTKSETPIEPQVEAAELPKVPALTAELTKLGTDKARTRFNAKGVEGVSALVYLPGQLPEQLKGQTLDLTMGEATGSKTKDGRTKITWESSTPEGNVLVLGYVPEDAKHLTGLAISF